MMCRPAQISIGIMNDGPGKIRRWSQRIKHHQVVLLSARSALCCSRARRRSVPKVRAHRFSVCLQQAGTNQHRNNERWSRKNTALVPSDQAPSNYDFRGGGPLFLLARDPQLRFTRLRLSTGTCSAWPASYVHIACSFIVHAPLTTLPSEQPGFAN